MLEFLWSGQDGFFELARKRDGEYARRLCARADALSSLAGNDYFGPLARASTTLPPIVCNEGNVLWADIDDPEDLNERLESEIKERPSVLVESGNRGFWAYWKLSHPVPAPTIESWNRGIARRLGADLGSCERTQLARLPGSHRPETGRVATVAAFSGTVYGPEELAYLRERPLRRLLHAAATRLR
jgi:hypothetical protein